VPRWGVVKYSEARCNRQLNSAGVNNQLARQNKCKETKMSYCRNVAINNEVSECPVGQTFFKRKITSGARSKVRFVFVTGDKRDFCHKDFNSGQ